MAACSVCFELFKSGDSVSAGPCGHILHNVCWNLWLPSHNSCPLCQARVFERNLIKVFFNGVDGYDHAAVENSIEVLSVELAAQRSALEEASSKLNKITNLNKEFQAQLSVIQQKIKELNDSLNKLCKESRVQRGLQNISEETALSPLPRLVAAASCNPAPGSVDEVEYFQVTAEDVPSAAITDVALARATGRAAAVSANVIARRERVAQSTRPASAAASRVTSTRVSSTRVSSTRVSSTRGTPTRGTPTRGTPTRGTPTRGTPTRGTPTRATATRVAAGAAASRATASTNPPALPPRAPPALPPRAPIAPRIASRRMVLLRATRTASATAALPAAAPRAALTRAAATERIAPVRSRDNSVVMLD